jgi:hypothetical protein
MKHLPSLCEALGSAPSTTKKFLSSSMMKSKCAEVSPKTQKRKSPNTSGRDKVMDKFKNKVKKINVPLMEDQVREK